MKLLHKIKAALWVNTQVEFERGWQKATVVAKSYDHRKEKAE